jgi:hypothetical protein
MTAPAPPTTTTAPAAVTTSAVAPQVAGQQFNRPGRALTDPLTNGATFILLSGLIVGALRTVAAAARQP